MPPIFDAPLPSPVEPAEPCAYCTALLTRRKFIGIAAAATASLAMAGLYRTAAAVGPVHWSYEGDTGPANWGKLSPDYAVCAVGKNQSPVDIPATAPVNPASIVFGYQPTKLNIFNNGHTVQVNYDPGSSIQVEGKSYGLVQFHFHTRSEHTFAGKPADMELHLVHQDAGGNLAVVGVLLNKGQENAAYAPVWLHLPPQEGSPQTISGVTVNADALLPADRSFYRYNGSLTTPPCSEGVNWLVMRTPVQLSDAQVTTFQKIFPNNARPVQPLNNRAFGVGGTPPVTLPATGGVLLSPGSWLLGVGALVTAAGLFLRRRQA